MLLVRTRKALTDACADNISGEQVVYVYDVLNRLASAGATSGTAWGQAYTYDGFGNLTGEIVTAGSAPSPWQDDPNAAVGYKFPLPGSVNGPSRPLPVLAGVPNGEEKQDLDTVFYDRNGQACGRITMKFVQVVAPKPPGYSDYSVDNPDIAYVLHLISACARQ